MKKIIKKSDEEFAIFQEFWSMLQNFFEPESTDEYWDDVITKANEFVRVHENNLLCEQLMIMMLTYLENKMKDDKTSSYVKLYKKTRWAYEDFVKNCDEKDRQMLDETLCSDELTTEQSLIRKVRQLHDQEAIEKMLGGSYVRN